MRFLKFIHLFIWSIVDLEYCVLGVQENDSDIYNIYD